MMDSPEMEQALSESQEFESKVLESKELIEKIRSEISKRLIGQNDIVDQVLCSLLCGGHVLLEGVPGLGKTLLVRTLAQCFNGQFSRVQFTPDLMPSDVTGHSMYEMGSGQFILRKGPAFTNLLLADEINRAPAKTQAAMLEVMQELQITIDGESHPTLSPFMVLATQNPIDNEGTYPLPEAELDRFMMKVLIDYLSQEDEEQLTLLNCQPHNEQQQAIEAVLSPEQLLELKQVASSITIDAQLIEYAVKLVRATRSWHGIARGASTRACISLVQCARAQALIQGSSFVLPDHIKAVALPILRHRIALSADFEIEGFSSDQVLKDLLKQVEAPRA